MPDGILFIFVSIFYHFIATDFQCVSSILEKCAFVTGKKMKKLNVLFVAIITGILLLPSFLYSQEIPAKRQGWPSHLRILSGATGGQWEILGNAISDTLNNKLIPSSCKLGRGMDNMDKIEQNLGDLAFSMSCFLPSLNQKDSLRNNTVLLVNLYPQVLYILLRKKPICWEFWK